jgi:hypothetical protein
MSEMSNRPGTLGAGTITERSWAANTTKDIRPGRHVEPQSAIHRLIVSRFTAGASVAVIAYAVAETISKAVS